MLLVFGQALASFLVSTPERHPLGPGIVMVADSGSGPDLEWLLEGLEWVPRTSTGSLDNTKMRLFGGPEDCGGWSAGYIALESRTLVEKALADLADESWLQLYSAEQIGTIENALVASGQPKLASFFDSNG